MSLCCLLRLLRERERYDTVPEVHQDRGFRRYRESAVAKDSPHVTASPVLKCLILVNLVVRWRDDFPARKSYGARALPSIYTCIQNLHIFFFLSRYYTLPLCDVKSKVETIPVV